MRFPDDCVNERKGERQELMNEKCGLGGTWEPGQLGTGNKRPKKKGLQKKKAGALREDVHRTT